MTLDKLEAWQTKMDAYLNAPAPTGNMPRHRLGCHLIGNREGDLQYIEALRPAAVKIVDPDPTVVRRVLAALDSSPMSICILRDHPLSEQKTDMAKDPVGTGKRHAADWIAKLSTGRFKEFGGDNRVVVCGINEPDVHNQAEERIVFEYTKALLEGLTTAGIRGLALNLSVGWPRNTGDGTPPTWETFLPLEPIINRGNHLLCTHEYWYPNVEDKWGWYGNRISKCPMSVPIIIGECGYTRQLANLPQPWGWKGNLTATAYAAQLWKYTDEVDANVMAVLPFTSGFASSDWESKDILPVAADILARKHNHTWPAVWPVQKGAPPVVVPPVVIPPVGAEQYKLLWPKMDRITGFFGSLYAGAKTPHSGVDVGIVTGTPLRAIADGYVAYADFDTGGYGNYVRVMVPALGFSVLFGHMSRRDVVTGQAVKRGDLLGLSGSTGNSSGPHVHIEVRLAEDGHDRQGVSAFGRAQVDPLAVKYALGAIYGFDEYSD